MAVITISRQIGSGGWTLGKSLAKRLEYRYVDEVMIKEVADKVGVTPEAIHAFEKDGATKLMKFLDRMVSKDFINRLISDRYGYVDEERYVGVVTAIIRELYERGNVIIVGRAGQYILKDCANAWRILLVDGLKNRIRFVKDTYNLTETDAEKLIKSRDRIRTNFLSFFADRASHDDPRSYDLAINMENMDIGKAEELILNLISR
jgi:cytidylate kinase